MSLSSGQRGLFVVGLAAILAVVLIAGTAGPLQASLFQSPIPNPSCSGSYYTVRYGDTLSRIAYRFHTSISAIMRCNRIANANLIYAGQRLLVPGSGGTLPPPPPPPPHGGQQWYRVVWGDTLWKIALRFGVSTASLIRLNGLRYPYIIYAGQLLRIR